MLDVGDKAGSRFGAEEVGVVLEIAADALLQELELEGEVEAREPDIDRQRLDIEPRQR